MHVVCGQQRVPRLFSAMPGFGKTLALLPLAAAALHAQSPELSRISPMSARPGETVTVTLQGKNLQQPQQIWTGFGGHVEWQKREPGKDGKVPKPDDKKLTGKLTLAAEAPLGIGFLRMPTATGMSGPLFFLVDELPVVTKNAKNASAEKAQVVAAPVAVEGAAEAGRSDFYRFEMKAGQSLSVEAFAVRIGSKMDPALRLFDAHGRELVSVDDTPGLAGDCRTRYRAGADGALIVEIRDSSFAGGGEHFYHLRVGDFPLVSTVYPPAAAPGASVEVQVEGEAVEGIAPVHLTMPKSANGVQTIPVRFAPGKPPAFAYARADDLPIVLEKEPNDTPETALAITAPCAIYGRIGKPGDRDVFLLPAKKGESFTITPITRDLGSPAVLFLGVEDDKGTFIAANDNPGNGTSNDMALTFRAPRDGACRITIEDMERHGGAEFVYGARVERSDLGFELSYAGDGFVAPRGGSFSAKITARRRTMKGPITLELASGDGSPLSPGFHCEQNVIDQGKNDTQIKVTVPADVPVGTIYHARIVGRGLDGAVPFSAIATPPKADPNKPPKDPTLVALLAMPQPPRLLRETFPVCVGPDAPAFFAIELTTGKVTLPAAAGQSSFVLRQKSIDPGFEGDAQLKFEGLPDGIEIKSGSGRGGRIAGQVDFICEVTGRADLKPRVHTFGIVATAEYKGVQKTARLNDIRLEVTE